MKARIVLIVVAILLIGFFALAQDSSQSEVTFLGKIAQPVGTLGQYTWQASFNPVFIDYESSDIPPFVTVSESQGQITLIAATPAEPNLIPIEIVFYQDYLPTPDWEGPPARLWQTGKVILVAYGIPQANFLVGFGDVLATLTDPNSMPGQ